MADEFGSAYRAHATKAFAQMLRLEPCTTAVRSPESDGIAESLVKTIKRDYINLMLKPDNQAAVMNLAVAFNHYNEHHPHSALGYRSPREYIRRRLSQPYERKNVWIYRAKSTINKDKRPGICHPLDKPLKQAQLRQV